MFHDVSTLRIGFLVIGNGRAPYPFDRLDNAAQLQLQPGIWQQHIQKSGMYEKSIWKLCFYISITITNKQQCLFRGASRWVEDLLQTSRLGHVHKILETDKAQQWWQRWQISLSTTQPLAVHSVINESSMDSLWMNQLSLQIKLHPLWYEWCHHQSFKPSTRRSSKLLRVEDRLVRSFPLGRHVGELLSTSILPCNQEGWKTLVCTIVLKLIWGGLRHWSDYCPSNLWCTHKHPARR